MNTKVILEKSETILDDPPLLAFLTKTISTPWIWIPARLILGIGFLQLAASHKSLEQGMSLADFLRISARTSTFGPSASHKIIPEVWIQNMMQELPQASSHYSLEKLIANGELAIGLCLIFGAFFGMISLFSILLNWKLVTVAVMTANVYILVASLLLIIVWNLTVPQIASYRIAMAKRKRLPRLTVG